MKIAKFWTWFQQNEHHIRHQIDIKDLREDNTISLMLLKLQEISPHLGFEIIKESPRKKSPYILSISCCGYRDVFLMVETVVAKAPKIEKWVIKAFIQPTEYDFDFFTTPYPFYPWNVAPNTIKFAIYGYDLEKEIYEVILLLPLQLRDKKEEDVRFYLYNMFIDIWGEKFVALRINDVHLTFKHEKNYSFIELEDMQYVLEEFKYVMGFSPNPKT